MKTIDLNIDLAEGGSWDRELLDICTTANICCGAHAGSAELAIKTAEICKVNGVRICAHPGYEDRENMGRINRLMGDDIASVAPLLSEIAVQLQNVPDAVCLKPHGAFYHQTGHEPRFAAILQTVLIRLKLDLIGFPVGLHRETATKAGVRFISEGFVDRKYGEDGRLLARTIPGSVIESLEESVEQAIRLAGQVDTLCLHSDTPGCVETAAEIRVALEKAGYRVAAD